MNKISLITATYNSEKTIEDTIRSVDSQTYMNIEYLVIDGDSKDETVSKVKMLSNRLTKIVSETDNGIYDAYNKGLALATGEILGCINSDDFYCSDDVIEKVMQVFEDDAVDAVYADLVYVDQEDTDKILRYWKSHDYHEGDFAKGFVPAHPTFFIRKSIYEKIGGYDLNYRLAADYEFLLRAFHKYKIRTAYLPKVLVKMRVGGATGENASAIRCQNLEIFNALDNYNIKYSKLGFIIRKIFNRFYQRFSAKNSFLSSEI